MTKDKQIQPAEETPKPRTIAQLLASDNVQRAIATVLPNTMTPERLSRLALGEIRRNDRLGQCTVESLGAAIQDAATIGLEIGGPLKRAYLVPYKNKGVFEAQLQIDYRGLCELAYRTGKIETIYAEAVYKCDKFVVKKGIHRDIEHVPGDGDRNKSTLTHVYAVVHLKGGGFLYSVMDRSEIEKHERMSKSDKFWGPWFEKMALKTVIRDVLNLCPMGAEDQLTKALYYGEDVPQEPATVEVESIDRKELGDLR